MPTLDGAIVTCEDRNSSIMHDYSIKLTAQFYASLFIEEGNIRRMQFMTEGKPHFLDYSCFATLLGYSPHDFDDGQNSFIMSKPLLSQKNTSQVALSFTASSRHCSHSTNKAA